MMRFVSRDEREAGVDLAADRLALIVVSYGLLLVEANRELVIREEYWDLNELNIVSGVVGFGYRVRAGVANGRLAMIMVGAAALAAIAALALGLGIGR